MLWSEVEHKLNVTTEKQNKTNLELNVHRYIFKLFKMMKQNSVHFFVAIPLPFFFFLSL